MTQTTPAGTRSDIRATWVAFGENGAFASIHAVPEGFAVRLLDGGQDRGVFESLEVAKRALTTQRADQVTFEQH
jgi:hypothetical protein